MRTSDPRRGRLLTWATLRWIVRHRAWSRHHLVAYARMLRVRITQPHIVLHGPVFLGRGVELEARRGFGRLEIGRFAHIGDRTRIRCHEGSLRIGEKAILGCDNTINVHLDVEIGGSALFADWVYICDFDHRFDDIHTPIKDQGIVKSPVRIGPDCWIGTKVTVLRGSRVGRGAVLGAHAVVRGDVPEHAVAVGAPARVVRDRVADYEAAADQRAALADLERTTRAAAEAVRDGIVGETARADDLPDGADRSGPARSRPARSGRPPR